MKTINKVLILSVVAVAMATVSNAKADGALLSPRAKGNQVVMAAAPTNVQPVAANLINPNPGALLSPRAQGNQIIKVAGTNNDPDLAVALQSQYGSPKGVQTLPLYQIAPMK